MQWPEMDGKMPLDFDQAARFQPTFLPRQIELPGCPAGLRRLHPRLGYPGRRILAELPTVIQASSGLASLLKTDRRDCAQFHFPCWASPILKDEPARAGFAEPKSKTRDAVIPIDMLRFAGRQRQRVNVLRCELHEPPVDRPLGRTWEDTGWPSLTSGGRDDS